MLFLVSFWVVLVVSKQSLLTDLSFSPSLSLAPPILLSSSATISLIRLLLFLMPSRESYISLKSTTLCSCRYFLTIFSTRWYNSSRSPPSSSTNSLILPTNLAQSLPFLRSDLDDSEEMRKKLLCSLEWLLSIKSNIIILGRHYKIIKMLILTRSRCGYTSVLSALHSYKESQAQRHLHEYQRSEEELKQIKKGIDYRTINKNSKGVFRFRQFLFQEKVEQNYIAPLNLALLPLGRWTREDMKTVNTDSGKTRTEEINEDILRNCAPALQGVFRVYYQRIGKPRYNFILQEEIGKVSKMTPEQFHQFLGVLKRE